MALFLKILEGDSPATAEPVVATNDPAVIAAVGRLLAKRLGADGGTERVLALVRPNADPGAGQ